MGFSTDTAITTDADFFKIAGEQEMENLLHDGRYTDFSDMHKQAVNEIMRSLKGMGYDPSTVTNTTDFKSEAVYWILMRIWTAEALAGRGGEQKAIFYKDCYAQAVMSRVVVTADGTETARKGLPMGMNPDEGHWFFGDRNGSGYNYNRGMSGYDEAVKNRPV